MMLRWISEVPPPIEYANDARYRSAQRPSSSSVSASDRGPTISTASRRDAFAEVGPVELDDRSLGAGHRCAPVAGDADIGQRSQRGDVGPGLRERANDLVIVEQAPLASDLDETFDGG